MGLDKDKKYLKYYFVLCTYHSVQLSHALKGKKREKTQLVHVDGHAWCEQIGQVFKVLVPNLSFTYAHARRTQEGEGGRLKN